MTVFKGPDDLTFLVDLKNGVLSLSFNRPAGADAGLLATLFRNAQADKSVRCILIRGEGKIFYAGGDLAAFGRSLQQDVASRREDFARRLAALKNLVEAAVAFDRPIVVSLRGAVAGFGLLYPLVADYVVADPTASFVFAHQRVGLSPDGGITALLPTVVGLRTARSLLLTAAKVDSAEAHRIGLVTRIVSAEALEDEAAKQAMRFAAAPQRAVALTKSLCNQSFARSLSDQIDREIAGIIECVGSDDFVEGVSSFVEKRAAIFPSTLF